MKRFKDILCVIDLDNVSHTVLERALSLAEKNHASLTLVNIVPQVAFSLDLFKEDLADDLLASLISEKEKQLRGLIDTASQKIEIVTKVLTGVPFLETIYEVLRHGHDLVMKTPDKADWLDHLFGSDDMHLLRKCPCPVWMIKPDTPKSYQHILAAVDVDSDDDAAEENASQRELNQQILQMSASLAIADFSQLHIAHAWDAPAESLMHSAFVKMTKAQITKYVETVKRRQSDQLQALLHDVAETEAGEMLEFLKPDTHLVRGSASEAIPKLAKQIKADLIVMGTVGRTGIPGFTIGNTAEDILSQIDCSILAIKPPGFVSPVTLVE